MNSHWNISGGVTHHWKNTWAHWRHVPSQFSEGVGAVLRVGSLSHPLR